MGRTEGRRLPGTHGSRPKAGGLHWPWPDCAQGPACPRAVAWRVPATGHHATFSSQRRALLSHMGLG